MRTTLLFLLALASLVQRVSAETWRIHADGTGDAPNIQAGIDSAAPGDTVLLTPGVFTGIGNRDLTFRGKAIVVKGEGLPEEQVIDCSDEAGGYHRGFLFSSGEGPGSVLYGLTIRNGSVPDYGGGICCRNGSSPMLVGLVLSHNDAESGGGGMSVSYSSPEIVHTVFEENTSRLAAGLWASRSNVKLTGVRFCDNEAGLSDYDWAGGMAADSCTVLLDRVVFLRNTAPMAGAAVFYLSRTTAIDCTFEGNTGTYGGCVFSYPLTSLYPGMRTTFRNCTFSDNDGLLVGGALVIFDSIQDSLIHCTFTNNAANYGGALNLSTSAFFDSCLFDGNVARARGGVARTEGCSATFRSCVFTRNASADSGGIIHAPYWSELEFENCTIANNSAPHGVVASLSPDPNSWLHLRNTIVSYCDSGEAILCTDPSVCAEAYCCDFYANEGGDGIDWETAFQETDRNFSADPLFCDTTLGDYALDASSPCLNAPGCGLVGARGEGCNLATSVADPSGTAPLQPFLAEIAPNPFNAAATVRFGLPEGGDLLVTVHDTAGRRVAVLADRHEDAGVFTATWDGRDEEHRPVPSGIYLVLLRTGSYSATTKAVLVR